MVRRFTFLMAALAVLSASNSVMAADMSCLNAGEIRRAVSEGKALRLSQIKARTERAMKGEIVHASLCREEDRLVYVLTVLRREGKVERILADAVSGARVATQNPGIPARIKARPKADEPTANRD